MTPVKRRRALDLVELGGVLPSGDVRRPEVFRSALLEEVSGARALEAAEKAACLVIRWARLAVGNRARRCRPPCFLRTWSRPTRAADLSVDRGREREVLAKKHFRRLSKRTAGSSAQ